MSGQLRFPRVIVNFAGDAGATLLLVTALLAGPAIAGKISFSRIVGNQVRYTPDDLRRYLAGNAQGGNSSKGDSRSR